MPSEQDTTGCPHKNKVQQKQLLSDNNTITATQNLWHEKGYNGCIFSQVIAHDYRNYHWEKTVINEVNDKTAEEIDRIVKSAADNPEVRLLSLVFPSIQSPEDLIRLCEMLSSATETIFLLQDEFVDGLVALSLRVALENDEVLAWIMGFGPFDFFAETRQAPYTELIIPVKKKPDNTYHRHNQDKSSAHVADQHIELEDKVLDRIWGNTFKKTERVLGHKPNIFSGARTTFTVPADRWNKHTKSDDNQIEAGY